MDTSQDRFRRRYHEPESLCPYHSRHGSVLLLIAFAAEVHVCEEPNVMIVLDRSGSMRENNKWNYAQKLRLRYKSRIFSVHHAWLGLMFFQCCDCGTSNSPATPCQVNSGFDIGQRLLQYRVHLGGTPTGQALNDAASYFQSLAPDRRSFVVLVIDGAPVARCPNCGNARNAAQNLFNWKIFLCR